MCFAFFLIFIFFIYDCDYYLPKWFFLFLSSCFFISLKIYEINIFASITYFYCMFFAGRNSLWTFQHHFSKGSELETSCVMSSLRFIVFLNSSIIASMFVDTKMIIDAIPIVSIIAGISSILPVESFCKRTNSKIRQFFPGGNLSANSTLVSILASACLVSDSQYSILGFIVATLGVFRSGGLSGSIGVLSASVVFFHRNFYYWIIMLSLLSLVLIDFFFFNKIFNKRFFSDSGRISIYRDAFCFFNKETKIGLFGIGAGTFFSCFPFFEIKKMIETKKTKSHVFPWLHSDVLQFYIENGAIGSLIIFFFLMSIFFKTITSEELGYSAFFLCFFVNALFNFPFRLANESFLFCIFLKDLFLNR